MRPFIWPSRIRFADTDASGRIHYSALFRHVEAAEMEFFRAIGKPFPELLSMDVKFPRVHVEADYLAALRSDDPIEIAVWVDRIGRASFTLAFEITTDGLAAGRAKIVVACMDGNTQKSHTLPEELVRLLRPHMAAPALSS
jgi:acyl-CoA thioester hydrolase